jgi:hypothetical protein
MFARAVRWGDWSPSRRIVSILTLFFFFPYNVHPPSNSFEIFLRKSELSFSSIRASKGFRLAHFPCVELFFCPRRLKLWRCCVCPCPPPDSRLLKGLRWGYLLPGELGRLKAPPFLGLFRFWWVHSVLFDPLPFGKLVRFPLMIVYSSSLVSSRFCGSGWRIGWRMYR